SPDGKMMAIVQPDPAGRTLHGAGPITTIRLVRSDNGGEIVRVHVEGEHETPVAWSADGHTLATHSDQYGQQRTSTLRLWDTATGKEIRKFTGVTVVCSPDLKTVVVVTKVWGRVSSGNIAMGDDEKKGGGDAFVFDAMTGKQLGRLTDYTFAAAII